jgi:hypothetical protein
VGHEHFNNGVKGQIGLGSYFRTNQSSLIFGGFMGLSFDRSQINRP